MSITIADEYIPGDHVGAVVARLRAVTNLLTLCPDQVVGNVTVKRIAGEFRPLDKPQRAVTVLDSGGFGGEMPLDRPRVSVYCYAGSGYEAAKLARLVQAALVPLDRQETMFIAAGVVVTNVTKVTGFLPLPLSKPLSDKGWHCRVTDFLLLVNTGVRAA